MSNDAPLEEWSAKWFEAVLDTISDQVLVKGPNSQLRWANKAFCDYYGMSVEQLKDLIDSPASDPDDTVQYVRDDHHVFSTGETLNVKSEAVTDSNGDIRYFNTVKSALRTPSGEVFGTVGVGRLIEDESIVTDSKLSRAENKANISELRTLVTGIPTPIAMLDMKLRFMARSGEWLKMFPSDSSDAFEFYDQKHESRLPLDNALRSAIASGEPNNANEMQLELSDSSHYVDARVQAWRLPTGEIGGAIIMLNDITSRLATEKRLQAANDELLQFNYRASHDLVAPLRTIRGLVSIAQAEMEKGQLDKLANLHTRIKNSAETLSDLVMNILKLSQSYGADENEEIEISQLVQHVIKRHSADITSSGVKVHVNVRPILIDGEPTRFMQVIDNLLSNALKYYDPNQPKPFIEFSVRETDDKAMVLVTDNGIGIDDNMVKKIFDIFQRGSANQPGSGLGLYLAQKHATHMGGNLRVLNNRNNTVMQLTLNKSH